MTVRERQTDRQRQTEMCDSKTRERERDRHRETEGEREMCDSKTRERERERDVTVRHERERERDVTVRHDRVKDVTDTTEFGGGGERMRERETNNVMFLFVYRPVARYKGIVSSCSVLVNEEEIISGMCL